MTGRRKFTFAVFGGVLLAAAVLLVALYPYRAQTVVASAGGCDMRTDIVEPISGEPQGSVVLLHGLSANKRIMWYIAEGFAAENLRVFVPDLPGHGRTPGPFTPERAESCAESFVQRLIDHRAIVPQRTILAGHSMGGAIAMRIASRLGVAGVVAISPAPQHSGAGIGKDMLPFRNSIPPPEGTLAMRGTWEPSQIRDLDHDFLVPSLGGSSKYVLVPRATHVSLLFDSEVIRESQGWAGHLLAIGAQVGAPSLSPLFGALLGIVALSILVVPFLHEVAARPTAFLTDATASAPRSVLLLPQVAVISVVCAAILKLGVPLRFLKIFQGDYLASFFLLSGLALLVWNWKLAAANFRSSWRPVLAAAFAGVVLLLLFSGWLDLTFSESWLTVPRWLRFPGMFLALLPWHFAEECILAPYGSLPRWKRLAPPLAFRAIAWLAMTAALFFLHSGEILIVLLSAYFAVFFVLQRLAVDVVHRQTRSPAAAAVFGAILFAGLALAIFPVA